MDSQISGITVNGIELHEFLENSESKEIRSEYKKDTFKHRLYKKPVRGTIVEEPNHGSVKIYSKEEINMESLVRAAVKYDLLTDKVACTIINSKKFLSIKDITDIVRKSNPKENYKYSSVSGLSYLILKNILQDNIERQLYTENGKTVTLYRFVGKKPSISSVHDLINKYHRDSRLKRIADKQGVAQTTEEAVVQEETKETSEKNEIAEVTFSRDVEHAESSQNESEYITTILDSLKTLLKHNVKFTITINVGHDPQK